MAREGRFGHLPRAAPNLSGLIVQMVREIMAQDDANMLNAWEEGGEVDGKPVTDQRLLAHFKKRRNDIPKSDPEWDKWDQAVTNYTFTIAESKMTLRYAQHKVGEAEVANFYRTWAKKLPVNSEAYRELMRSAASFADAANARSAAASSGANQAAYDAASNAAYNKYERDYENVNSAIMAAAQRMDILQPGGPVEADLIEDLRGGFEHDHSRFIDLFDQIDAAGPDDPKLGDIYQYLVKQGYEHLTYGQWQDLSSSKITGLEQRIKIATQFDDASGAKTLRGELLDQIYTDEKVHDVDEFAAYQKSERVITQAMASGQYSPPEMAEMMDAHAALTERLSVTAMSDEDRGVFHGHWMNLTGQPVVAPGPFEITEGGAMTPTTSASYIMGQQANIFRSQVEEVRSGRAIWRTSLVPTADPMVPSDRMEWSTVRRDDPGMLDNNVGGIIFTTFNTRDASIQPVQMAKRPIVLNVVGEDGKTISTQTVGYAFADTNGVRRYQLFGGEGGRDRFMARLPTRPESYITSAEDQLVVTLTADQMGVTAGAAAGTLRAEGMQVDVTRMWQPWYVAKGQGDPNDPDVKDRVIGEYDNEHDMQFDLSTQTRNALMQARDNDLLLMASQVPANQPIYARTQYLPGGKMERGALIGHGPEAAYTYFVDYQQNAVTYHNEHVAENMDRAMVWNAGREAAREGKPFTMADTRLSQSAQFNATQFTQVQGEHLAAVRNSQVMRAQLQSGFQAEYGGFTQTQAAGAVTTPEEALGRGRAEGAPVGGGGSYGQLREAELAQARWQAAGGYATNLYAPKTPTLKVPNVGAVSGREPVVMPAAMQLQRYGTLEGGQRMYTPNPNLSMSVAQQNAQTAARNTSLMPRIDPRLMRRSDEPTIRSPRFRPPVFATPRSSGAGSADMAHWLERYHGS